MQPEDVQKAIDSATKWVDDQMTPADLVAVATINSSLQVLTDFTSSKEHVHVGALGVLRDRRHGVLGRRLEHGRDRRSDSTATTTLRRSTSARRSSTRSTTTCACARSRRSPKPSQPIQQKKAILYFSSGMQRSGTDNQVELRAAVNAAVRANVAIYPVDARGLQAVVPGGDARQGSSGGLAAFTGAAVTSQFTSSPRSRRR